MNDADLRELLRNASTMTDAEIMSAARKLMACTGEPDAALREAGEAVIGLCATSPADGALAGIALLARLAGVDAGALLRDVEARLAPRPPKRHAPLH